MYLIPGPTLCFLFRASAYAFLEERRGLLMLMPGFRDLCHFVVCQIGAAAFWLSGLNRYLFCLWACGSFGAAAFACTGRSAELALTGLGLPLLHFRAIPLSSALFLGFRVVIPCI